MRRTFVVAGLALAAGLATMAPAHEGHQHKLMGTVKAAAEDQMVVESTEGAEVTIYFGAATKIERGDAEAEASGIAVGERVVVFYSEEAGKKQASRVLLPAAKKDEEGQ